MSPLSDQEGQCYKTAFFVLDQPGARYGLCCNCRQQKPQVQMMILLIFFHPNTPPPLPQIIPPTSPPLQAYGLTL